MIAPVRHAVLPEGIVALTATTRGMVGGTFGQAASQAFGELAPAVVNAGAFGLVRSCVALCPDWPAGPDDPDCRYVGGLVFGYGLADGSGRCERPDVALTGSMAWLPLAAGPYAVFLHRGPYAQLGRTWDAIYGEWAPAAGPTLRDTPPMEVMINDPQTTPPERLMTEIWVAVTDAG